MRTSHKRLWPDLVGARSGQYRPEGAAMTCKVVTSVPKFPEARCLCFFPGSQPQEGGASVPTISDYYEIPHPVPFIDIETSADNRLYVDPHAIRLSTSPQPFADRAVRCLDTFAEQVTDSIITGTPMMMLRGQQLLQRFVEPWETRLGMSRYGFQGHGGAEVVGTWIWDVLTNDVEALVRVGVLKHIEDLPLFVDGVDRDITSDITTRIIFDALAQFTEKVVHQYPQFTAGIHQVRSFTKQIWSADELNWVDVEVNLPVAGGRALLLVPEGWARPTLLMSGRRYYETSVLSFAQLERAVVGSTGKLIKTPKHRLRSETALRRVRGTNRAITMRAFENGEDLLAAFKEFVSSRFDESDGGEPSAA